MTNYRFRDDGSGLQALLATPQIGDTVTVGAVLVRINHFDDIYIDDFSATIRVNNDEVELLGKALLEISRRLV